MNFNQYSPRDINLYLSNTYGIIDNKPTLINEIHYRYKGDRVSFDTRELPSALVDEVRIHGRRLNSDNEVVSYKSNKPFDYNLPIIPVTLGFRQLDDYVTFLYKQQHDSAKKLPSNSIVRSFTPQESEFSYIGKSYHYSLDKVLLAEPEYFSIDVAYEKLTNKELFSAALHHNYALVKKGRYKNPVIYYMSDPVIEFDGTNFIPLVDDCHVDKFKLEVGLL